MGGSGFTVPVSFDGLTLVAGLLAVLAIALMLSGLVAVLRERRLRPGRLAGGLLLLLVGLFVFAVAGWAQTYRQLSHEELVGTLQAVPVSGQRQTFTAIYTPVSDGKRGTPQAFILQGDGWLIGGDVIKWQSWVNVLGVNTGYRTTRLQGFYTDINDENTRLHTAVALAGGTDNVYDWLRGHGSWLPFVEATDLSMAGVPVNPSVTYGIYVTTSGYLAKPA